MLKRLKERVFGNPWARLAYRAALAGAVVIYYADEPLSKGAWVAAMWAALEALTPLNKTVGVGK